MFYSVRTVQSLEQVQNLKSMKLLKTDLAVSALQLHIEFEVLRDAWIKKI